LGGKKYITAALHHEESIRNAENAEERLMKHQKAYLRHTNN